MKGAHLFKGFHFWSILFWAAVVPVSIVTGLWKRVEFVTFLSIYALVATHWGAWQASRAEVVQVEQAEEVNVEHADAVQTTPAPDVDRKETEALKGEIIHLRAAMEEQTTMLQAILTATIREHPAPRTRGR